MIKEAEKNKKKSTASAGLSNVTGELVELYDTGITAVSSLINNFYDTLSNTEHENDEMKDRLRDSLAKRITLRKKDFDNFFDEMMLEPEKKEKEIKTKVDDLIKEHKNTVTLLREKLLNNDKIRVTEFRKLLNNIQKKQKDREDEVRTMLNDFQKQHGEMMNSLQNFLSENKAVRISDIKQMMHKFHQDRLERKRKIEERARNWRERSSGLSVNKKA